jgi:hypothetical protein
MIRKHVLPLILPTFLLLAGATSAAAQPDLLRHGGKNSHELQAARHATEKFRRLAVAQHKGYALLTDAAGIACIDNPGVGGMGIHYANGKLVGDGKVNARKPDVLVYQPLPNGRMRLVALEYVVFQAAWDAKHAKPPRLFGQTFELLGAGNRYGLDPFYELHAWIWKHNPRGLFDDWNPLVTCPSS